VTDFVIILNNEAAVKAFSHGGNVTLGGGLSVAAGPYGRTGEVSATAKNMAAIYSYSKSKGLFAGISIEGSVILERKDANEKFYRRTVTAKELLSGSVSAPPLANELLAALAQYQASPPNGTANQVDSPSSTTSSKPPRSPGAPAQSSPVPNSIPTYVGPNAMQPPSYSSSSSTNPEISKMGVPPRPPAVPTRPDTVIALYDFPGQQEGDLPFKKGDMINIVRKGETAEQWWVGRCHGREGVFPANYCDLSKLKF
jgi:hypothetical protein